MLIVGAGMTTSTVHASSASAVGTCGELVQGFLSSGEPFHVTCPIDRTSTVSVTLERSEAMRVVQIDKGLGKLELSILKTAEYLQLEPCDIRVARWTDVSTGKGMGSSTADIVAGARAISAASDRVLNEAELAMIATSIESSDGTMYPGMLAFSHKKGFVIKRFPWWPQFAIVMLVPPQIMNTESVRFEGKAELGKYFDEILDQLVIASANCSAETFAECATESATLNQRFLPNNYFASLRGECKNLGADGICVGHTGNVVGLLYSMRRDEATRVAAATATELSRRFSECQVSTVLTAAEPC